jgi:N-acetyl-gamma-glutamyl-phosphate reductase
MVKVGILGAAGYTGGELIRLLINHPEAEIVFANSESNAGNLVAEVHEGLYGETDLKFTAEMPFDQVDVIFFCFGHGKSEAFLKEHNVPENVKIIDLAQDFHIRLTNLQSDYRRVGVNYNQVVKAVHSGELTEKKALALLYKLEQLTVELVSLNKEIIRLTKEFEQWLQR